MSTSRSDGRSSHSDVQGTGIQAETQDSGQQVQESAQPNIIGPGATIGILGGGQLGRMMGLAARAMGYGVVVLDPSPDCPASAVADRVIAAPFDDVEAAAELAKASQVITIEFENVASAALEAAGKLCPTRPGPHVLEIIQDRRSEKRWLGDNGFPVAPFRIPTSEDELAQAVQELGASVVKTAREGYDGKGQIRLNKASEAAAAFESLSGKPIVVEAWLPLDLELSVLVARSPSGEIRTFPAAQNHHTRQILDWSVIPGPISADLAQRADEVAKGIAEKLRLEGILAIEFFALADGSLLVNEMAPRPHNSGHATTEACGTSQFEQAIRAVCNLPLGSTEVLRPAAISNLLGEVWEKGEPKFASALAMEGVHLHLYGKKEARTGRKMGHLTALAATPEEAIERAVEARKRLVD